MTNLTIGDYVTFTYLKGADKEGIGPQLVNYANRVSYYNGTVEEIRNITEKPLSQETLSYGKIGGERSKNLVTVKTRKEGSKSFYDGRMIDCMVTRVEKAG